MIIDKIRLGSVTENEWSLIKMLTVGERKTALLQAAREKAQRAIQQIEERKDHDALTVS